MTDFDIITQFSSLICVNGKGTLFNHLKKIWTIYGEIEEKSNYIKLRKEILSKKNNGITLFLYTDEPGFFSKKILHNFVIPDFYMTESTIFKNQMVIFENGVKGVVGSIPPHYLKTEEKENPQYSGYFIDPVGEIQLNMAGTPLIKAFQNEKYIYGKAIARSSILRTGNLLVRNEKLSNFTYIAFAGQTPVHINSNNNINILIKPLEHKTDTGIIFETGYISNKHLLKEFIEFAERWNFKYSKIANYYRAKNWEVFMKNKGVVIYLPVENLNTTYEKVSLNDLFEITKFIITYGLAIS